MTTMTQKGGQDNSLTQMASMLGIVVMAINFPKMVAPAIKNRIMQDVCSPPFVAVKNPCQVSFR